MVKNKMSKIIEFLREISLGIKILKKRYEIYFFLQRINSRRRLPLEE